MNCLHLRIYLLAKFLCCLFGCCLDLCLRVACFAGWVLWQFWFEHCGDLPVLLCLASLLGCCLIHLICDDCICLLFCFVTCGG